MIIKELPQDDFNRYEKLSYEYGTIFNSLKWLKIFGDKVKIYGIYSNGNNLSGGFTVYKERKFGVSIYRNPPFTPLIGPFLKIDALNPVRVINTWKEAISSMTVFMDNLPYLIISFSLDRRIVDTQPFIWNKFKVVPGYTYILDLTLPIDDIWNRMSNERRNDIRKGQSDGLTVEQTNNFEIIKSLVLKTFSRQGKKINEYYLDKILFGFAADENSFAFVTFRKKQPIACSFCINDKYIAYYILGGYDKELKHHGAGALAMWEAIKYSKTLGLRYFDFEGSMVPQIERYFRGFGGILTPY
ncbi:MAG: GNAT family N-acetyltransferase, partial [Sediminibacterium sp.]